MQVMEGSFDTCTEQLFEVTLKLEEKEKAYGNPRATWGLCPGGRCSWRRRSRGQRRGSPRLCPSWPSSPRGRMERFEKCKVWGG